MQGVRRRRHHAQPGRLHITWQDDTTLKIEFDAGHADAPAALRTGAGAGAGRADLAGIFGAPSGRSRAGVAVDRNGIPAGRRPRGGGGGGRVPDAPRTRGGALKVVTTNMREGYLRKNGVPYSENAVITEYFDRLGPEPNGDVYLLVRTVVDDPKYLQQPFITSTHFKLEADGSKWNPDALQDRPAGRMPAKP